MISVRGEQYYDGVDPDSTELMTEGPLEQTADGLRISYQETELTGMEGTCTTFEIGPSRVILRRSGKADVKAYAQSLPVCWQWCFSCSPCR